MGSVYIIQFIETGEEYAYTTVTALCEAHQDIDISRSRLNMALKNYNLYKNKKIIVKKFKPLNATQVRELKGQSQIL